MLQKQIPFKAWSHHLTRFLPPAKRRGQMMLILRLLAFLKHFTSATKFYRLIMHGKGTFGLSAKKIEIILSFSYFLEIFQIVSAFPTIV